MHLDDGACGLQVIGNVFVRSGDLKSPRSNEGPGKDAKGNLELQDDPGFVDPENMDFRLKTDSLVFEKIPEFKQIPFEKTGLRGAAGAN